MKKIMTCLLMLTASAWAQAVPSRNVRALAQAIAQAEGFYVKGSTPNRLGNPGDIRANKGISYPGQIGLTKRGYVVFKNDRAGWAALHRQIEKVIDGESKYYTVNMTLKQFSKRYASSPTWVKNVSKILKVTPQTKLWEILDVPPMLEKGWVKCRK